MGAEDAEGSAEMSTSMSEEGELRDDYSSSGQTAQSISISMMDGSVYNFPILSADTVKDMKERLKKATGKSGLALLAENSNVPLNDGSTLAACGSPTRLVAFKQTTKVDEYKLLGVADTQVEDLAFPASANAPVDEDGSDVILCESSARAKVVAEAAFQANGRVVELGGKQIRLNTLGEIPQTLACTICRQYSSQISIPWK